MLEHIGLYYPYVRVRDDQWLKTAALYMPELARVVPSGYHVTDSPTARALNDELGFVVPVDPARCAQQLAPVFLDLLQRHGPALREAYRIAGDSPGRPLPYPVRSGGPSRQPWSLRANTPGQRTGRGQALADLHRGEVADALREAFLDSGLAVGGLGSWLTMDAAVAWCTSAPSWRRSPAPAASVPRPTSPRPISRPAPGTPTGSRRFFSTTPPTPAPAADDTHAVGLLALGIVTPNDLADVPVEKIIRVRNRHQDLFGRFSAEVTRTVSELGEELASVTLPEARELHIAATVQERFAEPLDELRGALTGLRIDTAFSAANLKFELPAVFGAGALGVLGDQPVLDATVGAAFALGALGRSASGRRSALLKESPTAYLLSVERALEPATLLRRLTHRG